MQLIEPGLDLVGFDISRHGLGIEAPGLQGTLFRYRAQDAFPWGDKTFRPRDLVGLPP